MLRALPAMVRTAASMSAAVRSGSLAWAISSSCWRVTVPTLRVLGRNLPFAGGAYFRLLPLPVIRTAASWVQRVQRDPVVYYFHPWELDSYRPDVDLGRWQNLRSQGGKSDLFGKLQRALAGQEMETVGAWAERVRETAPVFEDVGQIPG